MKVYFNVSQPNIVLETVKPAEDSDDIILRFYEAHGMRTRGVVSMACIHADVYETDLLENNICKVAEDTNGFDIEMKPYEIKTFRLVRK